MTELIHLTFQIMMLVIMLCITVGFVSIVGALVYIFYDMVRRKK